jgi:hypothetical protein
VDLGWSVTWYGMEFTNQISTQPGGWKIYFKLYTLSYRIAKQDLGYACGLARTQSCFINFHGILVCGVDQSFSFSDLGTATGARVIVNFSLQRLEILPI